MKQTKNDLAQQGIILLQSLAMSSKSKQQGKSKSVKKAFADIRNVLGITNKTGPTNEHE
ncbi:MAG: hypothetical protein WCS87_13960 [Methylococcaceae bacterium]